MKGIFHALDFISMMPTSSPTSSPDIVGTQSSARAESGARNAQRDVKHLRASLSKTMLICEALWELLSESANLTEEDLHKKMYEVDMRDGVLDGKNQRRAVECPDCGRTVSPRHPACVYCGTVIDTSVFTVD